LNKRIEIVVDPKGNSKVETKGFAGAECVEASKFIELALGKKVNRRTTADFFSAGLKLGQQARETR